MAEPVSLHSMPSSRSQQLEQLFDQALDLSEADQAQFLEGVDPELRQELIGLLKADAAGGPLDHSYAGLGEAAAEALEQDAIGPAFAGQRLGHYRLLQLLGEGGMASVWLAERDDRQFKQQVAVKCLKTGLVGPDSRNRFLREQQILAQLRHSNIARLYDAGVSSDGVPYIVMERIEGESLIRHCDNANLSLRKRIELFQKICAAVSHAHQNLIVHRDLKPGNILVDQDGEPKLLDFGIAKLLGESEEPMTRTGMRLLTPEYAAPEQFSGEAITTATDVYALGAVLYELLSGLRPYAGTRNAVSHSQATAPSQALKKAFKTTANSSGSKGSATRRVGEWESLQRALQGDLDTIVMKALQAEPSRRYATVQALSADIDRYLKQQPIEAHRDSWRYRTGKFLKRNVISVAISTLAVSILISAAGISIHQALRAKRETDRALAVKGFLTNLFEVSDAGLPRDEAPTTRILLEDGAKRIKNEFNDAPELKLDLLLLIGRIESNLGFYDIGEELLQEAVTLADADFSKNPEIWLQAHTDWSALLLKRSKANEAAQEMEKALARYRSVISGDSKVLPQAFTVLSQAYVSTDRYSEAVKLAQDSLVITQRLYGGRSKPVQEILREVGTVLTEAEKWQEAEKTLRESVALSRELYGEKNAKFAVALSALAVNLSQQGKNQEAEQLLRQAVAIDETIYDKPNATYVSHVVGLGNSLYRQRKLGESESVLQRALKMNESMTNGMDANTAQILHLLGNVVWKSNRTAEAESLDRKALGIALKLGASQTLIAQIYGGLALELNSQKKYAEAETVELQGLQINRELYGHDSRMAALNLADLSMIETAQGRNEQALSHLDESTQILEKFLPPVHLHLAMLANQKGFLLNQLERYQEATIFFERGSAMAKQLNMQETDEFIYPLLGLGLAYQKIHKLEEAFSTWQEALHSIDNKSDNGERELMLAKRQLSSREIALVQRWIEKLDGVPLVHKNSSKTSSSKPQ